MDGLSFSGSLANHLNPSNSTFYSSCRTSPAANGVSLPSLEHPELRGQAGVPCWGPAPPIAAHPKKFRTPARPAHTCGSGHAPSPGEHRPPGRGRGAALPHRPCLYGRFAVPGPPVPPRRSGAPSLCLYGAGRRGHVARAGRKRRERRLNEAGPVSAGVTPPSRRAGGCRDSPVA